MSRKSPFLFLSPLYLSLSIRFLFFPVCFPSFSFFFLSFSLFLIHQTSFLLYAPISFSHFLIFSFLLFLSFLIFLLFLSFSLFFHFLRFLFSISHFDCINRMVQKWGKLPPTFLHCHLSSLPFSLNFLIFLFPLFPSFDTWINVSHSHKCTTWLMSCVTPLRCHVASNILPFVCSHLIFSFSHFLISPFSLISHFSLISLIFSLLSFSSFSLFYFSF